MSEKWYDDTEDELDDEVTVPLDELEAQDGENDLGDAITGAGGGASVNSRFS